MLTFKTLYLSFKLCFFVNFIYFSIVVSCLALFKIAKSMFLYRIVWHVHVNNLCIWHD